MWQEPKRQTSTELFQRILLKELSRIQVDDTPEYPVDDSDSNGFLNVDALCRWNRNLESLAGYSEVPLLQLH